MADGTQTFYKGEYKNIPASITFAAIVTLSSATVSLYDASGNAIISNASCVLTVAGPAQTVTVGYLLDTRAGAAIPIPVGVYRAVFTLIDTNGLTYEVEVNIFVVAVP